MDDGILVFQPVDVPGFMEPVAIRRKVNRIIQIVECHRLLSAAFNIADGNRMFARRCHESSEVLLRSAVKRKRITPRSAGYMTRRSIVSLKIAREIGCNRQA